VNPPVTKRIYAGLVENAEEYFLREGWLLMARSGQIYGLNGRVLLVSHRHTRAFISEDLIRIVPECSRIRPGYLSMVLSHPTLGRPLVIRHAFGTSIPHLEPADLRGVWVPRLSDSIEAQIADYMEQASRLRSEADDLEDKMTAQADHVIEAYLHGT
jgi:type I restriction enzyme, S subunit